MKKTQNTKNNQQSGGVTHKQDKNAGSGGFNQGSEQDADYNKGVGADPKDLKQTTRKKENPKDGNIGKNNAGGYK
jgi:hypothetical protein